MALELTLIKEANGLTLGNTYKGLDQAGGYAQVRNDNNEKVAIRVDKFENLRKKKK